jgi:3'-phosphoadenosine 5'-phosphosulfate sulfotransferase (PAPS reductase)/FAD synthetase
VLVSTGLRRSESSTPALLRIFEPRSDDHDKSSNLIRTFLPILPTAHLVDYCKDLTGPLQL